MNGYKEAAAIDLKLSKLSEPTLNPLIEPGVSDLLEIIKLARTVGTTCDIIQEVATQQLKERL